MLHLFRNFKHETNLDSFRKRNLLSRLSSLHVKRRGPENEVKKVFVFEVEERVSR